MSPAAWRWAPSRSRTTARRSGSASSPSGATRGLDEADGLGSEPDSAKASAAARRSASVMPAERRARPHWARAECPQIVGGGVSQSAHPLGLNPGPYRCGERFGLLSRGAPVVGKQRPSDVVDHAGQFRLRFDRGGRGFMKALAFARQQFVVHRLPHQASDGTGSLAVRSPSPGGRPRPSRPRRPGRRSAGDLSEETLRRSRPRARPLPREHIVREFRSAGQPATGSPLAASPAAAPSRSPKRGVPRRRTGCRPSAP